MDEQRGAFYVVHCVMLRVVLVGLALLSLFDPPWALAGNRFHERNHTGLLALFGFDDGQRSDDLHPTTARDYTGLNLLGNLTTSTSAIAWSEDRAGFTIPSGSGGVRASSQQTTSAILQQLSTEFSIELFISTPTNNGGNVLIAGFGDWPPGSPFPVCDSSGSLTLEGGWRLYSALGNSLLFQAVMSSNGNPFCVELSFGVTPNTLRHCVLRGRVGEISSVSHSSIDTSASSVILFDPGLWLRHPAHLTFAVPQPTEGWRGSIYMISVYDRYLPNAEVATNREFGPPNSLAVTTTSSLAVTEDVAASLFP